jgi:hypothetical protein
MTNVTNNIFDLSYNGDYEKVLISLSLRRLFRKVITILDVVLNPRYTTILLYCAVAKLKE